MFTANHQHVFLGLQAQSSPSLDLKLQYAHFQRFKVTQELLVSHEIVPTNKKGYQPLHDTVFSESSNICVRQQLVKLLKKHELQMIMNKQPQGHRCDLQILNKNV